MALTWEDHLLEWATVGCLTLVSVLAASHARRERVAGGRYVAFYLLLAVAAALCALEELSWGQRILGIESPDFFVRYNSQGETNLHNIMQRYFRVTTKQFVRWSLLIYGVALPLLAHAPPVGPSVNRLLALFRVRVPPLLLIGTFAVGVLAMFDVPTGQEEEVGEFLLSLGLALFMVMERTRFRST